MSQSTRSEQRSATRQAIVDAAVSSLTTSGYSSVRTRAVAAAAGVAQGTVTYHFPSREALLSAAVTQLVQRQLDATRALVSGLNPADITADQALDLLWAAFTTPEALAAAHLWFATWSEPDLVATVRALEDTVFAAAAEALSAVSGKSTPGRGTLALLDLALSVVRGLVQSIPIRGFASVEARWERSKASLLAAVGTVEPSGSEP